ncbi:MAG: DUF3303 domain-containing protein [bacterium]|nr:DUF3303 domain-containing protein [bacterium]
MLFMIIEHYKPNSTQAIYDRFAANGRMLPAGVIYIDSWVLPDGSRCYQLMEAEHVGQLDEWASHWNDLVDFEYYPVVSSKEMAEKMKG